MSGLPFTATQFFDVFRAYNAHIWPAQFALIAVALAAVWAAVKPSPARSRIALILLGALWLWSGVVYHWLHFAAINSGARLFGGLFVLQWALFLFAAWRKPLPLEFSGDVVGTLGAVLLAAALVAYPLLGYLAGHAYLESPTFGAPCPLTIFTFGLLLWLRPRAPVWLMVIPVLWAVIGSSAFLLLGVRQDVLLPLSALLALAPRLLPRRSPATATR